MKVSVSKIDSDSPVLLIVNRSEWREQFMWSLVAIFLIFLPALCAMGFIEYQGDNPMSFSFIAGSILTIVVGCLVIMSLFRKYYVEIDCNTLIGKKTTVYGWSRGSSKTFQISKSDAIVLCSEESGFYIRRCSKTKPEINIAICTDFYEADQCAITIAKYLQLKYYERYSEWEKHKREDN